MPPPASAPSQAAPSYLRTFLKVLTGSAVAQAIPVLVMLVLARQVSVEAMGIYGIWLATTWIALVPASAKMDILLVTLPGAHERRLAFRFGACCAVGIGLLLSVVALLAGDLVSQRLPGWTPAASALLGLGTWALAMQTLWLARAVSSGAFGIVNRIRITSAGLTALLQVLLAWRWPGPEALMTGYVIGTSCASWAALSGLRNPGPTTPAPGEADSYRSLLRLHGSTPALALPAALLNTVAQQIPQLLTGMRFGAEPAGLLSVAWRTVQAPMTVISNSAIDVFKNKAADEFHRTGQCRTAYRQTLRLLAILGVVPSTILLLWGPALFALVFGEKFRGAGEIAQIFAPLLFIRFFASPLGYTLMIARKANIDLYWQMGLLAMSLSAFIVPPDAMTAFKIFSGGYAALYVIYLILQWRAAGGDRRTPAGRA